LPGFKSLNHKGFISTTQHHLICRRASIPEGILGQFLVNGQLVRFCYGDPCFAFSYHLKTLIVSQLSPVEQTALYRLMRINSRNRLTERVVQGIIHFQKRYLLASDPINFVPLSQRQLVTWLNSPGIGQKICPSWLSRLCRHLKVMDSTGTEVPMIKFFPTSRQRVKLAIHKLLHLESCQILDGTLISPYNDSSLKQLLQAKYGITVTRWDIAAIRCQLGIPKAQVRGQKFYHPVAAPFSGLKPMTFKNIRDCVPYAAGVYELRLENKNICYPCGTSSIFYLGRSKNLRKRLTEHLQPRAKNKTIVGFLRGNACSFRYLALHERCCTRAESQLYELFVATFGAAPLANRVRPPKQLLE
jgi:hypothetical protein